ncbi:MAG: hypothetical protein KC445_00345 [Anaerolineales bacterium]|nr:hypothetical protein [Anaerolineales bacterium]
MMRDKTADLETIPPIANPDRYLPLIVFVVGLLVVLGLMFTYKRMRPLWEVSAAADTVVSEQTLADQYGVRVNLLAVTAVGGMVDLRLKILDAEKASLLLQDSGDVPILHIENGQAVLKAPEDSTGQLMSNLTDDGNIFLAFPNVGNVLKPGMLVTIQFGEISLESIPAR